MVSKEEDGFQAELVVMQKVEEILQRWPSLRKKNISVNYVGQTLTPYLWPMGPYVWLWELYCDPSNITSYGMATA